MKLVKASPRREQGSEVRKLNEISGCEAPPPDVWVCKECAQSVHSWLCPTQPLTCSYSAAQLCLTLCDPMNCSPPGSCVHGILQARILEWVAVPSSGDLSDPGIKLASPVAPALAGGLLYPWASWEARHSAPLSTKRWPRATLKPGCSATYWLCHFGQAT